MLDNLQGSSENDAVEQMRSARESSAEQDSEPSGQPEETVEDEQAQEASEGNEEESEVVEQEEGEEEEEAELYTVTVGGKEREVSFDNLLSNYSKGEDYTIKTMALADDRKGWDAEKTQYQQAIAAESQKLSATMAKLSEVINEKEQDAEYWADLRDTDPSEYLRQKEVQDSRKQALATAQGEANQKIEVQRQEAITSESQKLLQAIGDDWKDPEKRDKDISDMYAFVESRGITKEESGNILDHRFWLMARDAMQYQKLQKTGSVVSKQIKKAPKTVKSGKPGKRVVREVDEAAAKSRKTGSVDDAIALMKAKRIKQR